MGNKYKFASINLTILIVTILSCLLTVSSYVNSVQIFSIDRNSSLKLLVNFNVTFNGSDKENKTAVDLVHGVNVQDLLCEDDEPLEWVYIGGGRPSKVKESTVRTESNLIQSTLQFNFGNQKSVEYSEHTGSYVCRTLKNKEVNSSVYIYFNGGAKVFLQENEARELLYLPLLAPVPVATEAELVTQPNLNFVIPCMGTTPNATVNLYRKIFKKKKLHLLNEKYDPKIGFTLTLPDNQTGINSLAGDYICMANTTRKNNVTFHVHLPKSVSVKATPSESMIYIGKLLNFTCESNEPIFIRETESNLPMYDNGESDDLEEIPTEDEIEETTEISATSLHVANHIDLNPIPGSYGVFQCQTDNEEKLVLHSWKYFVIGKEVDELSGLKYSKKKGEFRCRSKSNQPGLLSFVTCSTPSECAINRVCLEKWDSCTGYEFPGDNPTSCKTFRKKSKSRDPCTKVSYHGGSGFVRCVAEGIDEVREFNVNGLVPQSQKPVSHDFTLKTKTKSKITNANANTNTSDATLKQKLNLTLSDMRLHAEDGFSRFNLTLERSTFEFIGGHKWTALLQNGSSVDLQPESEDADRISPDLIHTVIKISKETMSHTVKIMCNVPLRESMDWKNVGFAIVTNGNSSQVRVPVPVPVPAAADIQLPESAQEIPIAIAVNTKTNSSSSLDIFLASNTTSNGTDDIGISNVNNATYAYINDDTGAGNETEAVTDQSLLNQAQLPDETTVTAAVENIEV